MLLNRGFMTVPSDFVSNLQFLMKSFAGTDEATAKTLTSVGNVEQAPTKEAREVFYKCVKDLLQKEEELVKEFTTKGLEPGFDSSIFRDKTLEVDKFERSISILFQSKLGTSVKEVAKIYEEESYETINNIKQISLCRKEIELKLDAQSILQSTLKSDPLFCKQWAEKSPEYKFELLKDLTKFLSERAPADIDKATLHAALQENLKLIIHAPHGFTVSWFLSKELCEKYKFNPAITIDLMQKTIEMFLAAKTKLPVRRLQYDVLTIIDAIWQKIPLDEVEGYLKDLSSCCLHPTFKRLQISLSVSPEKLRFYASDPESYAFLYWYEYPSAIYSSNARFYVDEYSINTSPHALRGLCDLINALQPQERAPVHRIMESSQQWWYFTYPGKIGPKRNANLEIFLSWVMENLTAHPPKIERKRLMSILDQVSRLFLDYPPLADNLLKIPKEKFHLLKDIFRVTDKSGLYPDPIIKFLKSIDEGELADQLFEYSESITKALQPMLKESLPLQMALNHFLDAKLGKKQSVEVEYGNNLQKKIDSMPKVDQEVLIGMLDYADGRPEILTELLKMEKHFPNYKKFDEFLRVFKRVSHVVENESLYQYEMLKVINRTKMLPNLHVIEKLYDRCDVSFDYFLKNRSWKELVDQKLAVLAAISAFWDIVPGKQLPIDHTNAKMLLDLLKTNKTFACELVTMMPHGLDDPDIQAIVVGDPLVQQKLTVVFNDARKDRVNLPEMYDICKKHSKDLFGGLLEFLMDANPGSVKIIADLLKNLGSDQMHAFGKIFTLCSSRKNKENSHPGELRPDRNRKLGVFFSWINEQFAVNKTPAAREKIIGILDRMAAVFIDLPLIADKLLSMPKASFVHLEKIFESQLDPLNLTRNGVKDVLKAVGEEKLASSIFEPSQENSARLMLLIKKSDVLKNNTLKFIHNIYKFAVPSAIRGPTDDLQKEIELLPDGYRYYLEKMLDVANGNILIITELMDFASKNPYPWPIHILIENLKKYANKLVPKEREELLIKSLKDFQKLTEAMPQLLPQLLKIDFHMISNFFEIYKVEKALTAKLIEMNPTCFNTYDQNYKLSQRVLEIYLPKELQVEDTKKSVETVRLEALVKQGERQLADQITELFKTDEPLAHRLLDMSHAQYINEVKELLKKLSEAPNDLATKKLLALAGSANGPFIGRILNLFNRGYVFIRADYDDLLRNMIYDSPDGKIPLLLSQLVTLWSRQDMGLVTKALDICKVGINERRPFENAALKAIEDGYFELAEKLIATEGKPLAQLFLKGLIPTSVSMQKWNELNADIIKCKSISQQEEDLLKIKLLPFVATLAADKANDKILPAFVSKVQFLLQHNPKKLIDRLQQPNWQIITGNAWDIASDLNTLFELLLKNDEKLSLAARTKISLALSEALLTPSGRINIELMDQIRNHVVVKRFQGTPYFGTFFDRVLNTLKDPDFNERLNKFPGVPHGSRQHKIFAQSLGLPMEQPISDRSAKLVILSALLWPVRQENAGSCFATSIVIQLSSYPDGLKQLLEYSMSLAANGSIRKNAQPNNLQATIEYPLVYLDMAAQNKFVGDNYWARSLEYTLASLAGTAKGAKKQRALDLWSSVINSFPRMSTLEDPLKSKTIELLKHYFTISCAFEFNGFSTNAATNTTGAWFLLDADTREHLENKDVALRFFEKILKKTKMSLQRELPKEAQFIEKLFTENFDKFIHSQDFFDSLYNQEKDLKGSSVINPHKYAALNNTTPFTTYGGGYNAEISKVLHGSTVLERNALVSSNPFEIYANNLKELSDAEQMLANENPDLLHGVVNMTIKGKHAFNFRSGAAAKLFQNTTPEALWKEYQEKMTALENTVLTEEMKKNVVDAYVAKLALPLKASFRNEIQINIASCKTVKDLSITIYTAFKRVRAAVDDDTTTFSIDLENAFRTIPALKAKFPDVEYVFDTNWIGLPHFGFGQRLFDRVLKKSFIDHQGEGWEVGLPHEFVYYRFRNSTNCFYRDYFKEEKR